MPRDNALQGTGSRLYRCEQCGKREWLKHDGIGYEKECPACGGVSYCDPFPPQELARRLDALAERLEAEDGALVF